MRAALRRDGVLIVVGLVMQLPLLANALVLLDPRLQANGLPAPLSPLLAIIGGVVCGLGAGVLVVRRATTLPKVLVPLAIGAAVFALGWWGGRAGIDWAVLPRRYATYAPGDGSTLGSAAVLQVLLAACSLALSGGLGFVLRCGAALVARGRRAGPA